MKYRSPVPLLTGLLLALVVTFLGGASPPELPEVGMAAVAAADTAGEAVLVASFAPALTSTGELHPAAFEQRQAIAHAATVSSAPLLGTVDLTTDRSPVPLLGTSFNTVELATEAQPAPREPLERHVQPAARTVHARAPAADVALTSVTGATLAPAEPTRLL